MHFEEYELFPSLIGLSPLSTSHPRIFQHPPVRSSTCFYTRFNLLMDRSLSFGSTASDYSPYSDSLSLRLRINLTSPDTITRRLIMQKAVRHRCKQYGSFLSAFFVTFTYVGKFVLIFLINGIFLPFLISKVKYPTV
jgi:hypothetical protein